MRYLSLLLLLLTTACGSGPGSAACNSSMAAMKASIAQLTTSNTEQDAVTKLGVPTRTFGVGVLQYDVFGNGNRDTTSTNYCGTVTLTFSPPNPWPVEPAGTIEQGCNGNTDCGPETAWLFVGST